jgi:hypothetical protein
VIARAFWLATGAAVVMVAAPTMARAQAVIGKPVPPPLPLRLAIQTEGARGVATGPFYNHMLGARLDVVFSPHVSFGGYLGYASLKGKDGRAGNLLPYASVEYLAGNPIATTRLLLRFASGYLPNNGPVARMAGGVAVSLTPTTQLVTELAPMFWVTNDQMLLSMNLAVELCFRL